MRRSLFALIFACIALFARPASAVEQLIINGGFDNTSAAPWVFSQQGAQVINGIGAFSGSQYLSLGSNLLSPDYAYQIVTFPTNLIAATLSFAYETLSSDPNKDDSLTVYLTTPSFAPILNLGTTTSGSPTGGWIPVNSNFTAYAGSDTLSPYAGASIAVFFDVTNDPSFGNLTGFNIDSVSLTAATTADIPVNDDFTNATPIPQAGITNEVVTSYASKEPGEPALGASNGGHSVWWTWTAPALGTVSIATTGSSFNTVLGVFTGTSFANLVAVTNNNGFNDPGGLASLRFPVAPGTQYHIALDGAGGQSGVAVFIFRFTQDTTPPVVKITSPLTGSVVSTSSVLVKGTASDNVAVAGVWYQLANADGTNAWQLATGTNNWTALVTNMIPGTNAVRVKAYDTSTNVSKIAVSVLNYIVTSPLSLSIIGGGVVSGATNGKPLNVGFPYTLTATARPGSRFSGWTGDIPTNTATLHFIMTPGLSVTANFIDVQRPELGITAPVAHERWSNAVFTVTGKAADNVGVAAVWLRFNSGPWTPDVNSNNGFTNWNAAVALVPGTNTVSAYGVDAAGNTSLTNSVTFIYVLSAPLAVQITGNGSVKPNYNNALLQISNSYSMSAAASAGYVFSNWTTTYGAVITNGPVLRFIMESNLDYVANFVPNPFTAVAGTYEGLFYNPNEVSPAGSGFFSAQVAGNGAFTATFQQGQRHSVSGQFSLTGAWSTNALKSWLNTAISLQLNLSRDNAMAGTAGNPSWTANIQAYRNVFSRTNPAPQAGKYTLVLPGSGSSAPPGGNGFGSVTVNPTGAITLTATLGDGTKVTPAANISEDGQWPLFVSLDGSNGMLLGWLAFTNKSDRDIDGILQWFKPAQPASAIYSAGFTNELQAVGSAYSFTAGRPVLDLTDGYVLVANGGLPQTISNQFALAPNDIVTGSDKLKLAFTPATGLFLGSVTNTAGKVIPISGVVLQKQTNGFGQFINVPQTGAVYLAPQ